jgi:hypothetical protein
MKENEINTPTSQLIFFGKNAATILIVICRRFCDEDKQQTVHEPRDCSAFKSSE